MFSPLPVAGVAGEVWLSRSRQFSNFEELTARCSQGSQFTGPISGAFSPKRPFFNSFLSVKSICIFYLPDMGRCCSPIVAPTAPALGPSNTPTFQIVKPAGPTHEHGTTNARIVRLGSLDHVTAPYMVRFCATFGPPLASHASETPSDLSSSPSR